MPTSVSIWLMIFGPSVVRRGAPPRCRLAMGAPVYRWRFSCQSPRLIYFSSRAIPPDLRKSAIKEPAGCGMTGFVVCSLTHEHLRAPTGVVYTTLPPVPGSEGGAVLLREIFLDLRPHPPTVLTTPIRRRRCIGVNEHWRNPVIQCAISLLTVVNTTAHHPNPYHSASRFPTPVDITRL